MRLLTKTSRILAVAVALVLSSSAYAERYIVVMKNSDVFRQVHSQVSMSSAKNLASLSVVVNGKATLLFANKDARIESTHENIHSMVVNTDDASVVSALKASSQVVAVEKEFFHPAPKPVAGFALTKPWNFSLAYARSAQISDYSNGGSSLPGTGPATPWGIIAVKAPQAWKAANYGKGARVAVIDTGIDKDHPALAPNFEQGKDFIHDNNTPYEFADKVGHGSHCAGTIAGAMASNGFTGVAPKAKILSGRVCSEQGCSNIAVAQAIDWAIAQKVDVISMSLGGAQGSAAEQNAVQTADDAGIVVVAAAGNDGTPQVSFPGAFPTVIAVGAVDNTLTKANFSQWGPELAVMGPGVDVISSVPQGTGRENRVAIGTTGSTLNPVASGVMEGAPEVPDVKTAELVFANLGAPEDFQKLDLTGKYALIQRGTIKFGEKVQNAIAANAAGVIIYNNEAGVLSGALTQDGTTVAIPVVSIQQDLGQKLAAQLNAGAKISASIQTIATDYAVYSGTSMATPHVAGVSALLRAANKNLRGADVKAILKSTAHALTPNDQNQTGSGFVDAEAAVNQANSRE